MHRSIVALFVVVLLGSLLMGAREAHGETTDSQQVKRIKDDGMLIRMSYWGEIRFIPHKNADKRQAKDTQAAIATMGDFIRSSLATIECGGPRVPDKVILEYGPIEMSFDMAKECEAGRGYAYAFGSELQKKFRPDQTTPPPQRTDMPTTTGFGRGR